MTPWMRRARSLLEQIREADLATAAAAVAYNAFLAFVPLALAAVGTAAVFGGDEVAVARVERALQPIAPQPVVSFVSSLMVDADARVGGGEAWLIAGSSIVALFLGSRAVVALKRSLALVSGSVERRPALQSRLVAMALTAAGGVSLLLASMLLVAGRHLFRFIGELVGWPGLVDLTAWLRVPVSALAIFAFLLAFYHWGPPEPMPRARLAATVATASVVLVSLGFGLYLAVAPTLGATFGALGAVAIAMVWLYLGALAILVGGLVAQTFRPVDA